MEYGAEQHVAIAKVKIQVTYEQKNYHNKNSLQTAQYNNA